MSTVLKATGIALVFIVTFKTFFSSKNELYCLVSQVVASTTAKQKFSELIPGSSKVYWPFFRYFENLSNMASGNVPGISFLLGTWDL